MSSNNYSYKTMQRQRPCAYCKEFGHHIRVCKLLEAKNLRKNPRVSMVNPHIPPNPATKNTFADLSSDDEIEDGEIVEDRILRMSVVKDAKPYCEPPPLPSKIESTWTRSNIKVIQIPTPITPTLIVVDSKSDDEEIPYSDYTISSEMIAYMKKIRGRSWVDIEYDSDL